MENWKKIKDFEVYEVSSLGRVRRAIAACGTKVGRILKARSYVHGGYPVVMLSQNNVQKGKLLHRLVAEAFIPNPKQLPEVNHKGLKTDCRSHKLEWRSKKGNTEDAVTRQLRGDGVSFRKDLNKWRARFYNVSGVRVHLGMFNTKQEAIAARTAALEALPRVL